LFYWEQGFLFGWVFSYFIEEKPFSDGLVDQFFQLASNQVETVGKTSAHINYIV